MGIKVTNKYRENTFKIVFKGGDQDSMYRKEPGIQHNINGYNMVNDNRHSEIDKSASALFL